MSSSAGCKVVGSPPFFFGGNTSKENTHFLLSNSCFSFILSTLPVVFTNNSWFYVIFYFTTIETLLTIFFQSCKLRKDSLRRCGGIGRHKGLKIPRWQHRTGSSPVSGTSPSVHMDTRIFYCDFQHDKKPVCKTVLRIQAFSS